MESAGRADPDFRGDDGDAIEKITRYHVAIERSMFRAIQELKALQMRRNVEA